MSPVSRDSIGAYIREQREQAKISLRQLAQSAGVSNPYLSQIERGLRRPSAEILQQIAKGLRISAEALYIQAGILDDRLPRSSVGDAIRTDPDLNERQKQMLVEIYESFRNEVTTAHQAGQRAPLALEAAPDSAHFGSDDDPPWAGPDSLNGAWLAAEVAEPAAAAEPAADGEGAAGASPGETRSDRAGPDGKAEDERAGAASMTEASRDAAPRDRAAKGAIWAAAAAEDESRAAATD